MLKSDDFSMKLLISVIKEAQNWTNSVSFATLHTRYAMLKYIIYYRFCDSLSALRQKLFLWQEKQTA